MPQTMQRKAKSVEAVPECVAGKPGVHSEVAVDRPDSALQQEPAVVVAFGMEEAAC